MIYGTLIEKATGKAVGHFAAPSEVEAMQLETDLLRVSLERLPLQVGQPDRRLEQARERRNRELDAAAWTIRPDSPLSSACQAEWLLWMQQMHAVLMETTDLDNIPWPEKPGLEYV